ncbi:MAG TPA: hypothetical protein ENG10_03720 [Candidatus Bathyarchaeota archaeon]|nr:hypothetical protein [Candidatus Bathyarchaeota archaeon]HEX69385.1 hypothetical protein [Candidatus Bathyarchaeota archaeon]
MVEGTYKIKYRKGDFEIELQGDKEWVERKFQEFIEGKAVTVTAIRAKELPDSLVEFLRNKGTPRKHTDIAIIFSYWLFHRENMQAYNIDDIAKCYDEARIKMPKNLTDTMNKLQKKGYVKPVGEKDGKKAWIITQSGEEYVEQMKG